MKDLTAKWQVWANQMPELAREGAYKADFAYDEDGRLWRRLYRQDMRHRRPVSKVTPWHIADAYTWFPAGVLKPHDKARLSNTRARLPKGFDRYIAKGERIEVAR